MQRAVGMARVAGRMGWAHPLFIHFRIDPRRLAPLLRDGVAEHLSIDRRDGAAWLTIAALRMTGPLPRLGGAIGRARAGRYRQVNLRTYVTGERGPGIVLLETEVDRRLPQLAARMVGMPY